MFQSIARAETVDRRVVFEFLDLSRQANRRIAKAIESADALLMEDIFVACQRYTVVLQRAKAGQGTPDDVRGKAALKAFQRTLLDAKIKACLIVFEAVAAEYLSVDTDLEAYRERLMTVVVPFVPRALAIRRDDRLIGATILASVRNWETRHAIGPTATGQHPAISVRETPGDVIDRLRHQKHWTMEKLAGHADVDIKQIYRVKRGAAVNSTTIMRIASALQCDPGPLIPTATRKSQR